MADLTYAQARALIKSDPLTAWSMLLSGNQPDGTAIDSAGTPGLPASLGQKAAAASTSVVLASATTSVLSLALTTTAAGAFASQACAVLTVENPSTNTVNILVGNVGSELLPLAPGEGRPFRCTNANQIGAKNVTSTSQTILGVAEVLS